MLRNTKLGRPDRQLLPALPSVNDFNNFLHAAQKLNGRWIDFSWKTPTGKMFTVSVSWSGTLALPVWRLYGGDENRSMIWEHQSCDIPLVFNLVASHAGMSDRAVQAEGALSRTKGSLGADEAHSEFYKFGEGEASIAQGSAPDTLAEPEREPVKPADEKPETQSTEKASSCEQSLYPEQLICTKTGLLTYPGFLFLVEREYELAKRTNVPLSLLLVSTDPKASNGEAIVSDESPILMAIPYIVVVQRKADVMAHYKDGILALLLPNTSITGAKVAARRILRALDNADDSVLQSNHFSIAAIDLVNDGPTLNVVLTAVEETSASARKSRSKVLAYRDVLLSMSAEQLASQLRRQQKMNAQAETARSSLIAQLKGAIISKKTGVFIMPVIHLLLEHDRKRAMREKRNLSVLILQLHSQASSGLNKANADGLAIKETLKCLAGTMRKVDVLAEYDGESFAVLLPDTSLAGVRTWVKRMKAVMQEELPSILGPSTEVRFSMSAANVMGQYPQLAFEAI
jgi:GGDEF domain-containing protein